MSKLNNKGITTIEVLICFVLVVIITVSMYATLSSFNERKVLEGSKEKIYNYKNLLTKDIQDDLIKVGLTHVEHDMIVDNGKTIYNVLFTLKDGSKRKLVIEQFFAASSYRITGSLDKDDYFMIKYGKPDDLINWELPNVGHSGYDPYLRAVCDVDAPDRDVNCREIKDLSINNVYIDIVDDNVFSLYIGFYHPDFSTKYGINIVAPIDYAPSGLDNSSSWDY